MTFAGSYGDSFMSAIRFFFPPVTAGFSLTLRVASKILAFLILKPAFKWQVGYDGMRLNFSSPYSGDQVKDAKNLRLCIRIRQRSLQSPDPRLRSMCCCEPGPSLLSSLHHFGGVILHREQKSTEITFS